MLTTASSAAARFRHVLLACVALLLPAAALSACTSDGADSGKVDVVVGFYPLQYLAERIGGEHVVADNLVTGDADPHGMTLSGKQVAAISSADLVLYLKSFQPAIDDAIKNEKPEHAADLTSVTDLKTGGHSHDHGDDDHEDEPAGDAADPHIWLDPTLMSKMAKVVYTELAEIDPDHADDYEANLTSLQDELSQLDTAYSTGLASCQRNSIVTSHESFGYLADAYGLQQVGIAGLSPDEEPSGKKLAEVKSYIEQTGATTIFYEELVSDKYAKSIAEQVGADVAVLSPIEVAPENGDYLSAMKTNLEELRTALGCS